jgi:hypothetical protein
LPEITSMVIPLDVLSLSKVPIGIFGIYRTIGDLPPLLLAIPPERRCPR